MPPLTGDPNQYDVDDFGPSLTGTCLCGSIKVTINDADLWTKRRGHLCHCANCRKVSGSYVASNLNIEEEKVVIEDHQGTLKRYDDYATGSGKVVKRSFCSKCGSPIQSVAEMYPGRVVLKMGMFPRIPAPEFETFALHRHPWQGRHEGVTQWRTLAGKEKL